MRMKFCTVSGEAPPTAAVDAPPWKHSKFGWGSEQKGKNNVSMQEHLRNRK